MAENSTYASFVGRLAEANVFVSDAESQLSLTAEFAELRTQYADVADTLTRSERRTKLEEWNVDGAACALESIDTQVLANGMALEEQCSLERPSDYFLAARALGKILQPSTESGSWLSDKQVETEIDNGVPEGFIALSPDEIMSVIEENDVAIIYCWRQDCSPCDVMREQFEKLVSQDAIPVDVPLGAIYGPEATDLLSEQYDVSVAPTTLFCSNGSVESRIVGSANPEALRAEIGIVAEQSD
ncbi:thioredoxin family protein [Halobellus salinisoli]|uniref:thioredoxin family protein n=1 Tax=Halobellus salinisoli TaxID=3108500 RepID=UPI003008E6BC